MIDVEDRLQQVCTSVQRIITEFSARRHDRLQDNLPNLMTLCPHLALSETRRSKELMQSYGPGDVGELMSVSMGMRMGCVFRNWNMNLGRAEKAREKEDEGRR